MRDPASEGGTLTVENVLCEWFAKCRNFATGFRPHPILGKVPICRRCDDKVSRLHAEGEFPQPEGTQAQV